MMDKKSMTDTFFAAMGGISSHHLEDCERVRTAGLPKKQEPKIFRILEPIGIVAMVAAVLAVLIVAPDFLKRKPIGAASGTEGTDTTVSVTDENGFDFTGIPDDLKEAFLEAYAALNWLDAEMIEQLEQDYKKQYGENALLSAYSVLYAKPGEQLMGLHCYGVFKDCIVILSTTVLPVAETKIVAGEIFSSTGMFNLYGYHNGVFYELEEAYEKGFISKEEIALAAQRHETVNRYDGMVIQFKWPDGPYGDKTTNTPETEIPQPSEDLLRQIEKDYTDYRKELYGSESNYWVMCYYGSYNGAVAVRMGGLLYPQVECRDEVAGSLFYYGDTNFIEVWKDGMFFALSEAYEQGVLTKEDVSILADRHNTGTYWSRYEGENPEPDISDIQIPQPSEDLLRQIEEDYMDHLKTDKYYPVMNYYGSYNGAEVVRMSVPAYMAIFGEMVAGYTFTYGDSNSIKVWKDGMFFTLNEAYEQGVLTKEDISILAKTHVEGKFIDFRPFEGELR